MLFLCCVSLSLSAQERLTGLAGNRLLWQTAENTRFQQKSGEDFLYIPSLPLPFTDDFSYGSLYPDSARWMLGSGFVNRSFGFRPPTWGVATLDALDAHGRVYAHASKSPFYADTMSSKPIRLDSIFSPLARSLTVADSVYFSFFYQPGGGLHNHPWEGLGDAPESRDSLILEFGYYTGDTVYLTADSSVRGLETRWRRVWSAPGMELEQFMAVYHLDSSLCFRQVMIPVTDSCFFNSGFQFRFLNIASLEYTAENPTWAGNVDYWNIDYVRLNRGRSRKDTFIDDIAIAANPGSLLQNYEAMPWRQFRSSELNSSFEVNLINLSDLTKNATYQYSITDAQGSLVTPLYDGGAYNITSYRNGGYQQYAPHARPTIAAISASLTAETDWYVTHVHHEAGAGDPVPDNDTVVFVQHFGNYYAYDDGTPEAGYTVVDINTYQTGLALEFQLNQPDTLRAVAMYLNHAQGDANQFDFTLCVWDCQDGMPGKLLYSGKVSQHFQEELFGFQLFELEEPVAISSCFFVGYTVSSRNFLNVGFDQNNNRGEKVRYYSSRKWSNSFLAGSPMIRPYVGDPLPLQVAERVAEDLVLYPNPAQELVFLRLPENCQEASGRMWVCSAVGQIMYQGDFRETLSVADYPAGMYIIRVQQGNRIYTGKVVKQ